MASLRRSRELQFSRASIESMLHIYIDPCNGVCHVTVAENLTSLNTHEGFLTVHIIIALFVDIAVASVDGLKGPWFKVFLDVCQGDFIALSYSSS